MLLPNTKFRFLRQTGGGIIYKKNSNETYYVLTDEGFFLDVLASEIVEVVSDLRISENIKPKENKISNKNNKAIQKNVNNFPVFDLHLNTKNEHVLDAQLSNFREKLNDCKLKNIKTCIFIHGNGDGILRDTIRKELKNSPFVIKFEPANSLSFGTGATKVFLK